MTISVKEVYKEHNEQMVKNLIHDKAAFNIDTKNEFHSWHEVFGFMHEEVLELLEEINELKNEYAEYESLMMVDAHKSLMSYSLERMIKVVENIINESTDIASVCVKAIEQLGGQNAKNENA